MRRIFTVFVLLVGLNCFLSAATYYSIASGNWTNATGIVWSTTSGGTAVSAGDYPQKGDVVYLEGHTVVLDYDLSSQPGIELYVDVNSNLTGTGTQGILIKAGGTLQIDGYLEVLSIDLKQGAAVSLASTGTIKTTDWLTNDANINVDGTLEIVGLFTNTGIVSGAGTLTAGSYTGTGTIFGIVANTIADGATISGYTWTGSSDINWHSSTNWSQSLVPTLSTHDVIIPTGLTNYPIISTTGHNCRNLTIESGGSLTINEVTDLTVSGTLNNTSNAQLVIKSSSSGDGSLIFDGDASPSSTVERYVSQGAWHQVACPTNGGNTSNFYDATNEAWFLKHTESTNGWSYITNIDSIITRTQGFDYWVTSSRNVVFTGALTKVDQVVTLDYSGDAASQGWNLFGNPFSSAIKWGTPSWDGNTNTSGFVYVWDNTYNSGDYRVSDGDLASNIIPMGQGFFVKATIGASLTIPKAARIHSSQPFYKSTEVTIEQTQFVRIQLDGENIGNTVFVGFPENGTSDTDFGGDADKLYSSNETPQLFAIENDKELCINANAPLLEGDSKTVPLNLVQVIDGEYSLSITKLDQLENVSITLEDVKTGITQDFRKTPQYTFMASSDDEPERFLLHFAYSPNGINNDKDESSNIQIYSYGKEIYIHSIDGTINQHGNVFVYDLMGRKILQQDLYGENLIKIPVNLSNTYVVVKVVKEGSVKTEKVLIK